MKKTTVSLTDLDNFIGVIVPCKSGIWYTNQMGGSACGDPCIEGVFIPLNGNWFNFTYLKKDPLEGHCETLKDRDRIDLFLSRTKEFLKRFPCLEDVLRCPTEKEIKGVFGGEAWVPLIVQTSKNVPLVPECLKDFEGKMVYLTYPNSD